MYAIRSYYGKYGTSGDSKGKQRTYPCGELEPFNNLLSPKSDLPHGIFYSNVEVNNAETGEIVVPMSISDSKSLEDYLLDPQGVSFIFTYRCTNAIVR